MPRGSTREILCAEAMTQSLRQNKGKLNPMRHIPEGSASTEVSYTTVAWIDTKFWYHKSKRGGDG